ncbi:MAG: type I-E CRISPR-associated protein Cas5/CasD [Chlorobiaceae bacterium]|nr:type I-E CRISPR-associated protein Cas5/CasD [Chlorobiaceae bacterium]
MSNPVILLWLEAPLQSWGNDSRFGRRDTLDFPTKSGLLGLLCCALGAGGEQRELLAALAPLRQTVRAFRKNDDRPPLLRDFQMVGSSFDDSDPWETMLIPKKRDGDKAVGGGTKMTYRYYLQDATFAVAMEVPESMGRECSEALQAPVWDVYLGRKCCVPTDLIFRGCFASEAAALEEAAHIAAGKSLVEAFCVLDGVHDGEIVILNDVPVQFGTRKKYRERRVTIIYNNNG